MSANTIVTSVVTGGSNNHTTTAEEANAPVTDFVTQGVVGAITLNAGSGGTGSFCVNQNTGSNMAINVLAGKAYITATPGSQNSQVLRPRASADYTAYTINSNSSGSTKYDWIYLKVDPTAANNPASDASDVTSIFTSRSSSNASDNGSPPTYGFFLAIVTVANGATAITNANITDKRFNASIGAQNGSLVVTQSATGQPAVVQAAGIDANVDLKLSPKGSTGRVILNGAGPLQTATVATSETTTSTSYADLATTTDTVTVTVGNSGTLQVTISAEQFENTNGAQTFVDFALSSANTRSASDATALKFGLPTVGAGMVLRASVVTTLTGLTPGSTVCKIKYRVSSGTGTFLNRSITAEPK